MSTRTKKSRRMRSLAAASVAMTLAGTLGACGSDKPEPIPPVTKSASPAPSPSPTPAAWTLNYTQHQLTEYHQALARYTAYQKALKPIQAKGKHTKAATALFKEYWVGELWRIPDNQLKTVQQNDIHYTGKLKVLASEATRIKPRAVTIRQCIDSRDTKTIRHGHTLPIRLHHPYVVWIDMRKAAKGERWLLYKVDDTAADKKATLCGGH